MCPDDDAVFLHELDRCIRKKQTIPREGFIQLAKDFHIDLNTDFLD